MRTLNIFMFFSAIFWSLHVWADDWPQWRGPLRDGVWREAGIVPSLPKQPKYRWRTAIGSGFAGPAVAGNRVFVCDRILAAGEQSGEYRWDRKDPLRGAERVLCLDADTGKPFGSTSMPAGTRSVIPPARVRPPPSTPGRSTRLGPWETSGAWTPGMDGYSGPGTTPATSGPK